MAAEKEANVVYAAGLVQGIVLVTFPAASTIFTDPGQYDLSNTQYGTIHRRRRVGVWTSAPASSARSSTLSAPGAAGASGTRTARCTISTPHTSWRRPGSCGTASPSP